MKSATHQGTCQCCGRMQMLPDGKLSKHGYSLEHGFFEGTCPGSGHSPFEVSKDLVEKFIRQAKDHAAALREQAADTGTWTGTDKVWILHSERGGKWGNRRTFWIKAAIEGKKNTYGQTDWSYMYQDLSYKLAPRYTVDSNDSVAVVRDLNQKKVSELLQKAEGNDQYVKWQRERIKGWKPGKLTPVAPEKKAPRIHMKSTRWNSGHHLCAGSAMGAQSVRALTTDPTKVTCPQCLKDMAAIAARKAAK